MCFIFYILYLNINININRNYIYIYIVRIAGGKKETQSLTWKKLPQCGEEKNHGKTDLLCVVQVQGTMETIYIDKEDRDKIT
jgi:hypothetical protein